MVRSQGHGPCSQGWSTVQVVSWDSNQCPCGVLALQAEASHTVKRCICTCCFKLLWAYELEMKTLCGPLSSLRSGVPQLVGSPKLPKPQVLLHLPSDTVVKFVLYSLVLTSFYLYFSPLNDLFESQSAHLLPMTANQGQGQSWGPPSTSPMCVAGHLSC